MKYNKFFSIMVILVLLGGVASLLSPILLNIWMGDKVGFTAQRICYLLLALIISLILQIILIVVREKFAKDYNIRNFKDMLSKYFRLSYDKINDEGPANLIERIMQAVNNIYTYMTGSSIKIWSSIMIMVTVLIIIMCQNIMLGLIMLALIPLNYFGYLLINKELMKRSKVLQENCAKGFQQILSYVGNTDYLKQCDKYDCINEQINPALEKTYGSMADINIFAQSTSGTICVINDIARTMILALAVYQYIQTSTSVVVLVLYTILLPLYFNNMSVVTNSNLSKRDMKVSLDLMKSWDNEKEQDGTKCINNIEQIKFDIHNLVVKDKTIHTDIKETFNIGDTVWVQGKSGSGKSTLVKLLPKFRLADSIYINGINIYDINNSSLRKRVAYLSQNVPIVNGTLRDNLFYNKIYNSELENKYKNEKFLSHIFEDKTMDSQIVDNGANLSGGEKQKIAIARALYDDVDVLILDEVTSNIDKESAVEILDRVFETSQNKIIFIISHDDLPLRYTNKVVKLDNVNDN